MVQFAAYWCILLTLLQAGGLIPNSLWFEYWIGSIWKMGFAIGNIAVTDLLPLDQQATNFSHLHFLISQQLSPSLKIGTTLGLNAETTDFVKPSSGKPNATRVTRSCSSIRFEYMLIIS